MNNEIEILKLLVELEVRIAATRQKLQAAGRYDEAAAKVNIMQVNLRNVANESWVLRELAQEPLKKEKYDKTN